MATKKRSGNNKGKANQGNDNPKPSSQQTAMDKAFKTTANTNVHNLKQEADATVEAKDLNQKLTAIEETLNNLETRFYLSHQEFEQLFNGVNERSDLSNSDINKLRAQLSKLNSSYQVLDTQSGRLIKESGRLALLIDKLSVEKQLSEFEQSNQEQNDNIQKSLESHKQTLEQQQQLVQQQEQKLQRQIDESNQKNSSAQQFLDQKQQALIQQTEALSSESESLKQYLQNLSGQTEQLQKHNADIDQELAAQKTRLDTESQVLGKRLDELGEKTAYEYQDLLKQNDRVSQQIELVSRHQSEMTDNVDRLDSENQHSHEKIKQKLEKQAEGLDKVSNDLATNQSDNQAQIEELVIFDQKLALEAYHLEQRTDILEREEKVHQEKIVQLKKQTQASTDLGKKSQRQVNYVIQREKDHFNLLSGGFLLLVIALVVGILFSYRHYQQMRQADYTAAEQNELQKKAIAKNSRAAGQLQTNIEQHQLSLAAQQRQLQQQSLDKEQSNYQQLQQQLSAMQQQLAEQQQQIKAKDDTIQLLSREVQEVDDNLQYLNNSVGPYAGYNRDAFQGKLKGPYWLQQQPAENFTIQLLQAPQKQQLFQFIQRYGYYLTNKLSYYRLPDKNVVLAYGSFDKQSDAQQALDVLPGTVSRLNQGIAQIKAIQSNL